MTLGYALYTQRLAHFSHLECFDQSDWKLDSVVDNAKLGSVERRERKMRYTIEHKQRSSSESEISTSYLPESEIGKEKSALNSKANEMESGMRVMEGERGRALDTKQEAEDRASEKELEGDRARKDKQKAEKQTKEMESSVRVLEGERDGALEGKEAAENRANAMMAERDRAREEKQAAEIKTREMEGRVRVMEGERDRALKEKRTAEDWASIMKSERDIARKEKHATEKKIWEMEDLIRAITSERDGASAETGDSTREMKFVKLNAEERVDKSLGIRGGDRERAIIGKEETDQSFVMSAVKPNLGKLALWLKDLTWSEVKLMALQLCIDFDTLRRIEEDKKEASDRLLCAMDTWLKSDTEASWKKVVEALVAIGKTVLKHHMPSSMNTS